MEMYIENSVSRDKLKVSTIITKHNYSWNVVLKMNLDMNSLQMYPFQRGCISKAKMYLHLYEVFG